VLTILVSAALVAYVLQLVVEPLSRRMPRVVAVAVVVTAATLVVITSLSFVLPLVLHQVQMLAAQLPGTMTQLEAREADLRNWLALHHIAVDLRLDTLIIPRMESLGNGLAGNLPGILLGSFSGFFTLAMILVCSFYFLSDGRKMWQGVMELLPSRVSEQAGFFRDELDRSLGRYLRGQLINAGLVVVSASTVFSLLGMTYGVTAGLIWGAVEIIPYFGLYLGLGTAILLATIQGGAVVGKIILAGLVIWWTKDNVIAPRVMSRSTGLHPILIIVAVLCGGKLAGFLGVLLAIPVAAVIVTTLTFSLRRPRMEPSLEQASFSVGTPEGDSAPERGNALTEGSLQGSRDDLER
jgi:predicted PurR-regulated permease PerM